jgi:hypothetical protein
MIIASRGQAGSPTRSSHSWNRLNAPRQLLLKRLALGGTVAGGGQAQLEREHGISAEPEVNLPKAVEADRQNRRSNQKDQRERDLQVQAHSL